MVWNNKCAGVAVIAVVLFFLTGCGILTDRLAGTDSLEEYHDKVRLTMAELNTYLGRHKADVRRDFGEPSEIERRAGRMPMGYQQEKIPFDEIWYYIYRQGIPGINARGSTKEFFFYKGLVVVVNAY